MAPRKNEVVGIQYLRGIAALLVVVFHTSLQLHRLDPEHFLLSNFQSGVDLFFVISGFVMVYSTGGGTSLTAVEFIKRRLIRIVPLYWIATSAAVLVLLLIPRLVRQTVFSLLHTIASFLFLPAQNPADHGPYAAPVVAVGWTLNYEMAFYLLFALGMALALRKPKRTAIYSGVAILLLSSAGFVFQPAGAIGFYTNSIMLEFVFGMVLASISVRSTKSIPWMIVVGLALIALLSFPESSENQRILRYGLIAAIAVEASVLAIWPRIKLLHLLGDASYSLYISHFFVVSVFSQVWVHLLGAPSSGSEVFSFYILGSVTCVVSGIGCWAILENPITQALRGLSTAKNGSAVSAV